MRSEMKYLGLGLLIGIVAAPFLISGLFFAASRAAPAPTVLPVSTDTATSSPPSQTPTLAPTLAPTLSPTPTSFVQTVTPYPTATIDPIQLMLDTGQLALTGPWTTDKQIHLYEASLGYIASTPEDSLRMAKKINGVRYGNPSNTCGPLAIAILRDAGLVNASINPHDFWLLNPWVEDDRKILDRTFPPALYDHFVYHVWLRGFNWQSFPLKPGDFMYIHAGGGGNFDHMLVVTRVDSALRAYSVTNFDTEDGFLIKEVMLYDPNDPNAGIFHTWTKEQNALLGSTGFGGFEVWRLRSP
jgi:hypothetical protein